ncbi:MAG: hypothetical protein ACE5JA_10160, partial [bacterium]
MKNETTIRKRYMLDKLPVRLGGLAANLARIKSFSDHPEHKDLVESLLEESKFFIEWTAPDTELTIQTELVNLQLQLALWQLRWKSIWVDPVQRARVAKQADEWSGRVLEMSGLLSRSN